MKTEIMEMMEDALSRNKEASLRQLSLSDIQQEGKRLARNSSFQASRGWAKNFLLRHPVHLGLRSEGDE